MADVRPPRAPAARGRGNGDGDGDGSRRWGRRGGAHSRWRARSDSDSRGQLLLVTSLAIAVLLVSLALLLNTAIYTENLATRSADPGSPNAVSYQRDAVRGVGGIVSYANANHAQNESALADALTASVAAWDDATARHAAVDANAAGVSVASTNGTPAIRYGTQVVQNRTRNFTAANGSADWVVAENLTADRGARAFRLSVRRDSLASDRSGAFRVDVTDGDETRYVYVYRNDSAVVVDDGTAASDADCAAAATNGTVAVDLTAGTVAGRECDALSAFAQMDDEYDVSYHNGTAANGTYSVVINESYVSPSLDPDSAVYADRSSGDVPYVAPAVYAVRVDVSFQSGRVTYGGTVRVAPGEADDR